jgi:polysaccharide export outer membrane protein
MVGLLLMGLVGLFGAPLAWAAASEKTDATDNKSNKQNGPGAALLKDEETRVYPSDLLFIQVFDVDQLTREYRVGPTGMLTFPLLSQPIRAAGLTPVELAEVISQKCKEAGVLSHPQISIVVRESRLHGVAVAGAVKNPQIIPVFGRITLMDLLTQAGGVGADAGATVTITRGDVARRVLADEGEGVSEDGKSQPVPAVVTIDLRRLLDTGDPNLNVGVYPGDRVTVQRAGIVYVVGAVNRPGGFPLRSADEELSVLQVLALAGNPTNTAARSKAVIVRKDPQAAKGRKEIPVDLKKVIKGQVMDPILVADDILVVPDSSGAKGIRRAADTAIWMGTTMVIWER